MRMALLISLILVGAIDARAQNKPVPPPPATTPPPATPPATTAPRPATPAQPTPAQPRRAPAATRAGIAITVTDPKGATLPGIQVELTGPTTRSSETDASGQLNLPGLQAGTYRLRFSGERVITFEREITLRAAQVVDVDVALNPAPEPPPPPAPEPPPMPVAQPAPVGPKGEPQTIGIVDLLDKEFIGRDPRRESLLACSGNERTTMIQLNEPMPSRLYENAEVVYYVLAGEGSVTLDDRPVRIATNALISVPRGTPHGFERRGNRPLVLLAVLGGEPCERAK